MTSDYVGKHRREHEVGSQVGIEYPGFSRILAATVMERMPSQKPDNVCVKLVSTGTLWEVDASEIYPAYLIGMSLKQ
jgi:hypothetical protein